MFLGAEHASLLRQSTNYKRKKVYCLGYLLTFLNPLAKGILVSSLSATRVGSFLTVRTNKLECWSLESFFSLV
jgi:hypothetical protein